MQPQKPRRGCQIQLDDCLRQQELFLILVQVPAGFQGTRINLATRIGLLQSIVNIDVRSFDNATSMPVTLGAVIQRNLQEFDRAREPI